LSILLSSSAGVAQAQGSTDQLGIAIASNDPAMAQQALDAGVDVNADLGQGRTPLITAIMMTKPAMVDFLLAHGADPNREANDGAIGGALTAVFFASPGMALTRRGDEGFIRERRGPALEILKSLAVRKPDFNVLVSRGPTRMSPLMIAAEAGVADVVKVLLDAGASANFANGGKYTALDYAVDRVPVWSAVPASERAEVARLLMAAGAQAQKKGDPARSRAPDRCFGVDRGAIEVGRQKIPT
jgi:hypothetical protein